MQDQGIATQRFSIGTPAKPAAGCECASHEAISGPLGQEQKLNLPVRIVLAPLQFYKYWISPLLPSACRFHPTCSVYMMQAIEKYGAWRGVWMGIGRLLRCHPFHEGGFDPVR